jgi:hypothetical protein
MTEKVLQPGVSFINKLKLKCRYDVAPQQPIARIRMDAKNFFFAYYLLPTQG